MHNRSMEELSKYLSEDRYIVIGSGPSAAAVCSHLIKNGIKPLVLDMGFTTNSKEIDENKLKEIDELQFQGNKKWFGLLSPYFQPSESNIVRFDKLNVCQSFNYGGFSRVWGGTFDFFSEYENWPEETIPKQTDFDEVREIVPHSVNKNSNPRENAFQGSNFALSYFQKLKKNSRLNVDLSTLAVETTSGAENRCINLGKCITGCPQNSIWFAGDNFTYWRENHLIDYFSGYYFERIEVSNGIEKLFFVVNGKSYKIVDYKRVFICCGAIGTGAAIIRSGLLDYVRISDSSTSFFGAVSIKSKSNLALHHTLSQYWVEKNHPKLRAQFYSPDSANIDQIFARFPGLKFLKPLLIRQILRVHPFICYLDPKLSAGLVLRKKGEQIELIPEDDNQSIRYHKVGLRRLGLQLSRIGLFVPIFMLRIPPPGAGFHVGASLAHGELTDHTGRLGQLRKVHIVDGSVLPSLEPGSVTPTLMANAIRIVRVLLESDGKSPEMSGSN
jgi:hypothetical protein